MQPIMYLLIELLLITFINSIICVNEVKNEFNDWRIIGGIQAQKGEFPHQVVITKKESIVCSASLIASKWIVTAAHCVTSNVGAKKVPEIKDKNNLMIRIGEYNTRENDSNRFDVNITQIVVHPKWNFTTKQNDIALIELSDKINFTQNINKIDIAKMNDNLVGQKCTISGWGETGTIGETVIIRKADIPIVDSKLCDKQWKMYDISRKMSPTQIFEGQICAGDVPDISSCHGDSGGPLQCRINGHKLLVGIVSFGNTECSDLNNDLSQIPNVYTRLSFHYDWIISKIHFNTSY